LSKILRGNKNYFAQLPHGPKTLPKVPVSALETRKTIPQQNFIFGSVLITAVNCSNNNNTFYV